MAKKQRNETDELGLANMEEIDTLDMELTDHSEVYSVKSAVVDLSVPTSDREIVIAVLVKRGSYYDESVSGNINVDKIIQLANNPPRGMRGTEYVNKYLNGFVRGLTDKMAELLTEALNK